MVLLRCLTEQESGGGMYDEQKRLIEQLMGGAAVDDSSSVIIAVSRSFSLKESFVNCEIETQTIGICSKLLK